MFFVVFVVFKNCLFLKIKIICKAVASTADDVAEAVACDDVAEAAV